MVRAPEFDGVSFPPGEVAPELERAQAGEDVMVEPAAQAAGIVAADFERLAHPVSRAAFALDARDGRLHPIADSRVLCHDASLRFEKVYKVIVQRFILMAFKSSTLMNSQKA